ncbi:hypothetical protein GCM10020331_079390 [Ectobacillus funiculus]
MIEDRKKIEEKKERFFAMMTDHTTDLHITAWVLGIILFFVASAMYRNRNSKAKK